MTIEGMIGINGPSLFTSVLADELSVTEQHVAISLHDQP